MGGVGTLIRLQQNNEVLSWLQQHTKSMHAKISIIALKGQGYDAYFCTCSRMIADQWMPNTLSCVEVSLNRHFVAGEESPNLSAILIWDCSIELVNRFKYFFFYFFFTSDVLEELEQQIKFIEHHFYAFS